MKLFSKKAVKSKAGKKSNSKSAADIKNIKREVYGLILISLGLLLALALISYHTSDPDHILERGNIVTAQNWMGPFGAIVANWLFQYTLGYPILFIPIILIVAGFYMLLGKPLQSLNRFALMLFLWSFLISILLALPEALNTSGNPHSFYPSGFVGGVLAVYLVKIFSEVGSVFLLTITTLILVIITFRMRFSTIPRFLGHAVGSVLVVTSEEFQRIWHTMRQNRQKRAVNVRMPKPGKSQPQQIDEDPLHDPFYQPSLPSEKNEPAPAEEELPENPLEIVHNHRQPIPEPEVDEDTDSTDENAINISETSEFGVPTGGDFEIEEAHVEKELDYDAIIRDSLSKYQFPSADYLSETDDSSLHLTEEELRSNARLLEEAMSQFGVKATVTRVVEGPVITLYEVKPAHGVKISQIVGLADDLALAMRAKGIRMLAPIPGKAAIGIEIPNREPSTVYFRSLVRSETFINSQGKLVLGMGKTISGEVYCADLAKMPHLLIAGATGSGKSVGINTMIMSLLYRLSPNELKFVLIDPKKLELSIYARLKDHYLATCAELDEIVITHPQNAILILRSVVNEMEERYDKLAAMGVRDVVAYNKKLEEYRANGETSEQFRHLPYLVVIIDELADLILTAAREVEEPITRLAQMARAVGIHLIMATQRPSVDILTGLIKANFPARVAYQVATRPDSKTILDMYGAEKLIGNGDMLFFPPGKVKPMRLQNALITTEEVDRIIKHIRKQPKFPPYELKLVRNRSTTGPGSNKTFERDELFEQAKEVVVRYQQGSVSLLQRKLKIGYARAARIVDELEEAGIVGPVKEGKARDVLVSDYSTEIPPEE